MNQSLCTCQISEKTNFQFLKLIAGFGLIVRINITLLFFIKLKIRHVLHSLFLKAPVPLEKWDGILDATKDGMSCTQIDVTNGVLFGSENCLFLNVYTPNVSQTIFNHF